jgi:hypothetical protein
VTRLPSLILASSFLLVAASIRSRRDPAWVNDSRFGQHGADRQHDERDRRDGPSHIRDLPRRGHPQPLVIARIRRRRAAGILLSCGEVPQWLKPGTSLPPSARLEVVPFPIAVLVEFTDSTARTPSRRGLHIRLAKQHELLANITDHGW